VLVGAVNCPVNSARVAMPCSTPLTGFFATPGTRGEDAVEEVLDFVALGTGTSLQGFPMEEEALPCTPMPCPTGLSPTPSTSGHAAHARRVSRVTDSWGPGYMNEYSCSALALSWGGLDDGPDLLLGRSCSEPVGQSLAFEDLHADFNVSSRGLVASPGPSTGESCCAPLFPVRQRAFGDAGTNYVDERPRVYPAGANAS
jgi:hypothetical protein